MPLIIVLLTDFYIFEDCYLYQRTLLTLLLGESWGTGRTCKGPLRGRSLWLREEPVSRDNIQNGDRVSIVASSPIAGANLSRGELPSETTLNVCSVIG